jgi:hypothetical protein
LPSRLGGVRLPLTIGFLFVDRELRLSRGRTTARNDELPESIVERRTHAVGILPENQPPFQRRRLPFDAESVFPDLRIVVTDDAVGLAKLGAALLLVQCQSLVCTSESEIDAVEGVRHA